VGDDGGEVRVGAAANGGDDRSGGVGGEPVRHGDVAEVE
jgi:hypothetical protein